MYFPAFQDTPFLIQFSFLELIERLENTINDHDEAHKEQIRKDLDELKQVPAIISGITDFSEISNHLDVLRRLLKDYFPPELTHNEIKAVT
ncbi:MAG: GAF domain-containing protein, partial [Chitinophagaceae bacterium]